MLTLDTPIDSLSSVPTTEVGEGFMAAALWGLLSSAPSTSQAGRGRDVERFANFQLALPKTAGIGMELGPSLVFWVPAEAAGAGSATS